ncbi:MAG: hypothetical protein K6G50_07535 [bacterium]|nr:hypothetical protein [bacterium]
MVSEDNISELESQQLAVMKLIFSRLENNGCLCPGGREAIAYRLAEIMTHAKDIYTKSLPRLVATETNSDEPSDLFDELAGLRMELIHMKDLIEDYEDAFLEAMEDQRKADGNEERLPDPPDDDWTETTVIPGVSQI